MADQNRVSRNVGVAVCPLLSGDENAGLLLDYCNRRLAPEMTAVFEQHVFVCPACQAFAASQSEVWRALDSFEAMPISEDFDSRLLARIASEGRVGLWTRLWNRLTADGTPAWRPAVPVAAVLILAVGLWVRPGMVSTGESSIAKVEAVDVELIETTLEDMDMLSQLGVVEAASPRQM